jgi:DNA polymerase-3 subunit delta
VAVSDLKPVYLLTGSDRPKIETALVRLRRHFEPEAIEIVNAADVSGDDVVGLCNAGSLFGDGRLVVVEDVDGRKDPDGRGRKGAWKAADAAAVAAYLKSAAPGAVLCLVGEDVKKTSPLGKACAKAGEILEYAVPKKKLNAWVAEQFRQRGARAEPEAVAALVGLVGEDLHALSVEVDKLATWAGDEPIGEREVLELVFPADETPTYALTDAWAAHDLARALTVSEAIFERSSKARRDTASRMAGALGAHFAKLRAVKRLAEKGVRPKDAAGELRMHPYYAERVFGQAEGFSDGELGDVVLGLGALDGALKGQSKLPPDLELQRALVDLAGPPQQHGH